MVAGDARGDRARPVSAGAPEGYCRVMSMSRDERGPLARRAFEALGPSPSEHAVLHVECAHSHHLAAVHATDAGLVYHTVLHAGSHGDRDRYDSGHHGDQLGLDWFDLLDAGDGPAVDDDLPAGCECGPHTLSRAALLDDVAAGRGKTRVG